GVQATSDPRVGEALQEASSLDPDPTVRTLAAYGLCARGDRRGVTRVVATLRERETQGADPRGVYSEAIRLPVPYLYRALGHAGGPEATRFLIEAAERAPQAVRLVAIPALALVRDDDGVERTLAALAGDRDPAVRGVAAYVLGERSRWRARP
ncbi:MAG: HEAT repeat domain-containing protein, partial [Candidatus Rokubacteria bacterium]|nr:HEAT repeat domain-containing protein [Candidatus Rokubacteria bacterium]